jgi:hypothetical protein
MQELKDRLNDDLAEINWQDLLPHAKRDVVIVVKKELDILDVGTAIAQDNSIAVSSWIEQQLISKPSSEQLTNWNGEPNKQFLTLIIQPFIVIQEKI